MLCGLIAFVLEAGFLTFCVEAFGMRPGIAKLPAGLAALTFIFFFNGRVTFDSNVHIRQALRFVTRNFPYWIFPSLLRKAL